MKALLATIAAGALLAGGCATKKYVRNTTSPIQAKVDQVGEQTTHNTQQIEENRGQIKQVDEKAQSGISAAQERASTADQHAQEAMNSAKDAMERAQKAAQSSDQNSQEITSLRQVVSNIDDYKLQNTTVVPFKFDQYTLTPEARQDLDKLADAVQSDKRFFIAVEGYTDSTGSKAYNEALSRKRADSVVEYLVAQHNIPIYRVHMIGLGEQKPVDDARNRAARAKNRRVEVKLFSADESLAALNSSSENNSPSANRANQTENNPNGRIR